MGLDMYLEQRKYVKNWNFEKENNWKVTIENNGKPCNAPYQAKEVVFEVGYWRKANQIHRWFVENVQDGQDDCKDYYVSDDQLRELLELCKRVKQVAKVKKDKVINGYNITESGREPIYEDGEVITNPEEVHEILPTSSGFFFGSTDYDEYYLQDINSTIEILEKALANTEFGDFYYSSSW